ncbi:ClpX C4-type zinc finger protein [Methylobacterium sp. NMS14P]|uniref:ClpX C4-type zinc finger protein n=1 Tax=Methylobacterium sp. NMS14P TaxID=2894310 RepID=UPI0030763F6C
MTWPITKAAEPLYCSFCGHSQYEVAALLCGRTVHICDECVEVAAWVVAEKTTPLSRAWRKTWQIVPPPRQDARRAR